MWRRRVRQGLAVLAGVVLIVGLVQGGRARAADDPSALGAAQAGARHCFAETGKCVRGAFWVFWQQHGGLDVFGFPISDEINERNPAPPAGDGQERLVQYFERARFEYHVEPGRFQGNVKLGLLGRAQWQSTYASGAPPPVTPTELTDPFAFCAQAGTVDYPSWLYQGAAAFTGRVRDPESGALVGLRCQGGQPLICAPGASDWLCAKANPSSVPPLRTQLYCQVSGRDGAVPGVHVDRTSIYTWTCERGQAVIERQVVTLDQLDERGYRRDAWRGLLTAPRAGPAQLSGTIWAWQRTTMMDGTIITAPDPELYLLTFVPDGQLVGRADCNRLRGRYTVDGARLTIVIEATTRAACGPDSRADRFLSHLDAVVSYVIERDQLHLSLKVDSGIMHFAPL